MMCARRFVLTVALAASASIAALLAAPGSAEARGFVAFGIGVPLGGYYYPPPAYYYPPPPAYYYPPPAVYSPPPASYSPPPASYSPPAGAAAGPEAQQTCREYKGTSTIDGRQQAIYGTACLQPDGTWRIVR
jgi:hypothetical protein